MATKSILKNVDIRDKKLGKALVVALESAASKNAKEVVLSRTYKEIRGDKINEIFSKQS